MGNRERGWGNVNDKRGTRNKERGRGGGNGKWENEKWKQNREQVIKLLKVHECNFGFVPNSQLPVPYTQSPVTVSGFCIFPLKRSK